MRKYLIDVNFLSRFSIWAGEEYESAVHINDELKDSEIWVYVKENDLTIATKDTDFSDMIIMSNPPPRDMHIKVGNIPIISARFNFALHFIVCSELRRYNFP